jgi:uncharacterized protein
MTRVIITGGTGLIGSALARELSPAGYEVIILTRNPAAARGLPAGVRAIAWDGRTAQGWGDLVNGDTVIVNLAGEPIAPLPWWLPGRRKRLVDSRVNAGRAVTAAVQAAQARPRVLVQSSAVGYYGPHDDEEVTEETPPGRDFLAELCVDWEASTAEVEKLGVRRAIIRTGLLLSRQGGMLPPTALPFQLFVGGRFGAGRQWWPWIHPADEIGAIRCLIENEAARGPFNLSAPNPVTNAEFSRALARALHRPALVPTPAFVIKLALGQLADLLILDGQRQLPLRLEALGYRFRFVHLEDALRDLYSQKG